LFCQQGLVVRRGNVDKTNDTSERFVFAVTVDLVALRIRAGQLCVLVVKRDREPFRGGWALPGGFVRRSASGATENLDEAAARELREETGLSLKRVPYVAQLGAYGDPGRDPRGDVITVAYLAVVSSEPKLHAGGDASAVGWLPVLRLEDGYGLAFDHRRIALDGVARVRELVQFTALATAFCGERFSIANLRRAYEIIWNRSVHDPLDPGNFQHRVGKMEGLLREAASQDPPRGFETLGLGPRPRSSESRPKSRTGLLDTPQGVLEGPLTLDSTGQAEVERLAAATAPRGGPKPTLYEPGPLIRRSGYSAPLERPILGGLTSVPSARFSRTRREPKSE
jgi:8-oxo-dGTP diphosphatase